MVRGPRLHGPDTLDGPAFPERSLSPPLPMADETLASFGYKFIPGPSGRRGDFVLRKIADETAGFTFEGPEHFGSLAKAVMLWVRERLVTLCGLEALPGFSWAATPYATPNLLDKEAPVLLLCCGDVPGGDAGTWSGLRRRRCGVRGVPA